jgi:hypothetical protein
MNKKVPDCKAKLQPNVIEKDVFEHELAICQSLSQEHGGKCSWGVCASCGVVPLLIKLHEGVVLEEPEEVAKAKKQVFNKK